MNRSISRSSSHINNSEFAKIVPISQSSSAEKIGVSLSEGLMLISIKDIEYCESQSNYTLIHQRGKKAVLVSKTLKKIASFLPSSRFIRVHQSFLVNVEDIEIISNDITLNSGKHIPVSNAKKPNLLRQIGYLYKIVK